MVISYLKKRWEELKNNEKKLKKNGAPWSSLPKEEMGRTKEERGRCRKL
jgi:hypothetical protein